MTPTPAWQSSWGRTLWRTKKLILNRNDYIGGHPSWALLFFCCSQPRLWRLEPSAEHLRLLAETMQSDEARESLATDLRHPPEKKRNKEWMVSLGGCVFEVNLFRYVCCMCVYRCVRNMYIYIHLTMYTYGIPWENIFETAIKESENQGVLFLENLQ